MQSAIRQAVLDQLQAWGFDEKEHRFAHQHLSGNGQVISTLAQVRKLERIREIAAEETRDASFMTQDTADKVNAALYDYYQNDNRNIAVNNAKHPVIEQLGFTSILDLVDATLLANLKKVAAQAALHVEATSEPKRERQ